MKLLCLSNGHGEDSIGVKVLDQIRCQNPQITLAALPIVGLGRAYKECQIPILHLGQVMPSGGFLYMSLKNLWQDVQGGLLSLSWQQAQIVKTWAAEGGRILAVGDIVPLAMAGWSGAAYSFVGTAKSDYYNPPGSKRSNYLPWEQWLMGQPRCQAVYPRDRLTTQTLQQQGIRAFDLGNPMMDGLAAPLPMGWQNQHPLTVLLLPGSRAPEAYRNWQLLLKAIAGLIQLQPQVWLIAALAPGIDTLPCQLALLEQGWQPAELPVQLLDSQALGFAMDNSRLIITQAAYQQSLQMADVAIAMAGTATEEFVGLGKPVISLPGAGPQFTASFARRQTQLLGCSVTLVGNPEGVGQTLLDLLANPQQLAQIRQNGHERMGHPGAAARIAQHLLQA